MSSFKHTQEFNQYKRGQLLSLKVRIAHSDIEKGFIKAEVIAFADYLNGGEQGAKDSGKMRQEGKGYVVEDGDVILFRFNV